MRTTLAIFIGFLLTFSCSAQLMEGELKDSKRNLLEPFEFQMKETTTGALYYRIAVDRTGKVTSAQLLTDRSTPISTPLQVRARSYALSVKFEAGTFYPAFHSGVIKINLLKKVVE
jgi:hypothetical protein